MPPPPEPGPPTPHEAKVWAAAHPHHSPSLRAFKPGTIVRHKSGGDPYVVTANSGSRAIAVKTIDISNPPEWDIIQ